jgi:FKBP-type peptidyl-prolyl cis-trans isomerase
MNKKNVLIIISVILIVIAAIYFWPKSSKNNGQQNQPMENQNNEQALNTYDIQGMKVEILKEGVGTEAKKGDNVLVHYTGTLVNGKKFDSSVDRGEPLPFILGQNRVIQGWELGILGMKLGEKRILTIPPELAYGSQAVGDMIPANSTLIFEVEMVGINK